VAFPPEPPVAELPPEPPVAFPPEPPVAELPPEPPVESPGTVFSGWVSAEHAAAIPTMLQSDAPNNADLDLCDLIP